MTRAKGVEIGVLLETSMRGREGGRRFLETLLAAAPSLSPERYDNHEPIKLPFDAERLDDALAKWGFGFLWRRTNPSVLGRAWTGGPDSHDNVYLTVPLGSLDVETVLRLFSGLARHFGLLLGYVHVRTDEDSKDVEHYAKHIMPFSQGLTTRHLREGLPGVPWGTCFGRRYVEFFGLDRLLGTPAHRVERVDGGVYVQLTETPASVAKDRLSYLKAQRWAQEHLDHDAFLGAKQCRTPDFSL